MPERDFKNIAVLGVGLLGGSLGLALKARDPAVRIVGVGHRTSSLEEALAAGTIDRYSLDPAEGVAGADLVVLCTSVGIFQTLLKTIRPVLAPGAVVTDVGSTKAQVVRLGERLVPAGAHFVGSHPMAGGERRGVTYARTDLYTGATCILTPTARTHAGSLARVERMWRSLGMRTVRLSPAAHDKALARVSHLPHAVAACLVNAQKPDELDLAGPGFIDATRIAGGDPAMWRDIFLSNARCVAPALDAMIRQLQHFRRLVDAADAPALDRLLAKAQHSRQQMLQRRLQRGWVEG